MSLKDLLNAAAREQSDARNDPESPLGRETRRGRGLIPNDLFCANCGDYCSEHAGDAQELCLFAPTRYVELSVDEWRLKMLARAADLRQRRIAGNSAKDKHRFFGGRK